eukprot:m.267110 g.267110  ORF g.267110 m.267110 type:complete len:78 (-) comp71119_c0_seq1:120-353(-)
MLKQETNHKTIIKQNRVTITINTNRTSNQTIPLNPILNKNKTHKIEEETIVIELKCDVTRSVGLQCMYQCTPMVQPK